jgi:hypothetical protein
MSLRVVQASGAQVLPPVNDPRATLSEYHAASCVDADHRRKSKVFAEMAASLIIVGDEDLCGVRFWESDSERCTKPAGHELQIHGNRRYAWGPALVVDETSERLSGGLLDLLEVTP